MKIKQTFQKFDKSVRRHLQSFLDFSERFDLDNVGLNYIEISHKLFWKNFRVRFNGKTILSLEYGRLLDTPRTFLLSDGSVLKLALVYKNNRYEKQVIYNGREISRSAHYRLTLAFQGVFIAGLFHALLGWLTHRFDIWDLRFGFGFGLHSAAAGIVYMGLGFWMAAPSRLAGVLFMALYSLDVILSQAFTAGLGAAAGVFIAFTRLTLLIPVFKGVKAVKRIEENKLFQKLSLTEFQEEKTLEERLYGEWRSLGAEMPDEDQMSGLFFSNDRRAISYRKESGDTITATLWKFSFEGEELIFQDEKGEEIERYFASIDYDGKLVLATPDGAAAYERVDHSALCLLAALTEDNPSESFIYPTFKSGTGGEEPPAFKEYQSSGPRGRRRLKDPMFPVLLVLSVLTGLTFFGLLWKEGRLSAAALNYAAAVIFINCLIPENLKRMVYRDKWTGPAFKAAFFVTSAAFLAAGDFSGFAWLSLAFHVFGGLALGAGLMIFLSVLALKVFKMRYVGGGDIKLIAVLGVLIGPPVVLVIGIASLLVLTASLVRYLLSRSRRRVMPGVYPSAPVVSAALILTAAIEHGVLNRGLLLQTASFYVYFLYLLIYRWDLFMTAILEDSGTR